MNENLRGKFAKGETAFGLWVTSESPALVYNAEDAIAALNHAYTDAVLEYAAGVVRENLVLRWITAAALLQARVSAGVLDAVSIGASFLAVIGGEAPNRVACCGNDSGNRRRRPSASEPASARASCRN